MQQKYISDTLNIFWMPISSRKLKKNHSKTFKEDIKGQIPIPWKHSNSPTDINRTRIWPYTKCISHFQQLGNIIYIQWDSAVNTLQFAWNHQPKLTNKTVKESEHVSSCLLFPFELYLVHSLQSNQLIKHCNLNCRKTYRENLYTGCLLSERAIHEMSLAEPISVILKNQGVWWWFSKHLWLGV